MNTITPTYNISYSPVNQITRNNSIGFTSLKPMLKDTVEFTQKALTEKDYIHAQKYASKMSHLPKFLWGKEKTLSNMNMKKIEGLQYGIPIFAGMSMKEIAFSIDSIHTVATLRSCKNACLHCYADAKPNIKYEKTEGLTNRMTYEDFEGLTDGIQELKKRLGSISINSSHKESPRGSYLYRESSLFHDSDSIELYLKDKEGKTHYFPELNRKLTETTGQGGFFDTAGWNIHDKAAQDRANEVAAYFANPAHDKELEQFNISINAFNPWSARAAELRKAGKVDSAERIEDKYAERMANVITTFTPVLNKPYFGILARALPDGTPNAEGFCEKDLNRMRKKIFLKVQDKYHQKFLDNPSFINNPEITEYYSHALTGLGNALSTPVDTSILQSGRYVDFAKKHSIALKKDPIHDSMINKLKQNPNDKKTANHFFRIIDANGDLYLTDYMTDIPTDIHFNFESKGLKTPRLNNIDDSLKFSKDAL